MQTKLEYTPNNVEDHFQAFDLQKFKSLTVGDSLGQRLPAAAPLPLPPSEFSTSGHNGVPDAQTTP